MGLLEYFGTLGMIFAYGLGLAPIPSLQQGLKDMEITNITIIYLLSAISNCSLWSLSHFQFIPHGSHRLRRLRC